MKGLTLIELVIVIAILGALYFLITPTVITQLEKARDARRKIDFNLIQKSLEQYYDSANCYPSSLPACNQSLKLGTTTYLDGIPCDPKTHSAYTYIGSGSSCSPSFTLYTNLERTDDISIDLAGCHYGCGPGCQYNYGIASPNMAVVRCGPTPTPAPTAVPTPTPLLYACSPGFNSCDQYDNPYISLCPKVFPNDPTCQNACIDPQNRCKNAAGKHIPQ